MFRCYSYTVIREHINLVLTKVTVVKIVNCFNCFNNCN